MSLIQLFPESIRPERVENRYAPQNGSELARLSPFSMPLRDHGEPAIVYTTAIQQEVRW